MFTVIPQIGTCIVFGRGVYIHTEREGIQKDTSTERHTYRKICVQKDVQKDICKEIEKNVLRKTSQKAKTIRTPLFALLVSVVDYYTEDIQNGIQRKIYIHTTKLAKLMFRCVWDSRQVR